MPVRDFALVAAEAEGPHPASPAATGAARVAALLGADLCALRPARPGAGAPDALHWARFDECGVRLCLPGFEGNPSALSVAAYEWVRDRAPPRVLFADPGGLAHATLLAREAGLLPRGLAVGLLVLDPLMRRMDREGRVAADHLALMALHLEALSAQAADFFVFADVALEAWFVAQHAEAAARPRFVLPGLAAPEGGAREGAPEIVLDAIPEGAEPRVAAFLRALEHRAPGAPVRVPAPRQLTTLLATRLSTGAPPPSLRLDLPAPVPDPFAARRPPAGSVVLQAAGNAGPLAWDAPPAQVVELGDDAEAASASVAARLGARGAAPPAPPDAAALRAFVAAQESRLPPLPPLPDPPPLVSVCIAHFDRPALLREALDSLAAQTWPHLEVVLVDDASPSPATRAFLDGLEGEFAARGWQLLRNDTELWQAASRNRAARAARGAFVLVMDDDNLALPHEVETMVRAALATGADAVGALQDLFRDGEDPRAPGRGPWVAFWPMGGPPALGLAWNIYGDVNVLFRREAFLAVGGYSELPEIGCEDYEIGAALALSGRRMVVLPEALYLYRFSAQNMAKGMSNERLFLSHVRPMRPALAACADPAGRRVVELANGAEHHRQQGSRESYWAGAPRPAAIPALGVPARATEPADFRAKLAALGLDAVARDRAAALAAALDDPARLHLALHGG